MPHSLKMPTILTSLTLLVVLSAPAIATGQSASFPKPVQGIWMEDNAEGAAQCKKFRAASLERRFETLAGAEIIGAKMWHSNSEYGEGNFYSLRALTKVGANSWRASTGLEMDAMKASPDSYPVTIFKRLEKQKLIARVQPIGGNAVESEPEITYFKCRNLPRDLYRAAG